jgi:hypothetical protein
LVAMDTLICGMRGVLVKIGVGDNVAVGVRVGNSGVNVGIGDSTRSTGITAPAVCVRPETIVCITTVSMEFGFCVGTETLGEAQARVTINKTVTDKRMGVGFRMVTPFGQQDNHTPKMRNYPLIRKTLFS